MKSLSNQQRLHQVDTAQLYENYRAAQSHAASYTYGMRWKTVRGTEYLFRDRDRRSNGKSFGPRSPQTEDLWCQPRQLLHCIKLGYMAYKPEKRLKSRATLGKHESWQGWFERTCRSFHLKAR